MDGSEKLSQVSLQKGGGERLQKTGEGHMTTEAETGVMLAQAKESWQPPAAGRGREQILPWSLQRESGPADTLISAQ